MKRFIVQAPGVYVCVCVCMCERACECVRACEREGECVYISGNGKEKYVCIFVLENVKDI